MAPPGTPGEATITLVAEAAAASRRGVELSALADLIGTGFLGMPGAADAVGAVLSGDPAAIVRDSPKLGFSCSERVASRDRNESARGAWRPTRISDLARTRADR